MLQGQSVRGLNVRGLSAPGSKCSGVQVLLGSKCSGVQVSLGSKCVGALALSKKARANLLRIKGVAERCRTCAIKGCSFYSKNIFWPYALSTMVR